MKLRFLSKWSWKKFIKDKVRSSAFIYLTEENLQKAKTREIKFSELKISGYLVEIKSTSVLKIIFSTRSKTLDIKENNPWKYELDLCVMCLEVSEIMDHFINCDSYGDKLEVNWKDIYEENIKNQFIIGEFILNRYRKRETKIKQQGDNQASDVGSTAPGINKVVRVCLMDQ